MRAIQDIYKPDMLPAKLGQQFNAPLSKKAPFSRQTKIATACLLGQFLNFQTQQSGHLPQYIIISIFNRSKTIGVEGF